MTPPDSRPTPGTPNVPLSRTCTSVAHTRTQELARMFDYFEYLASRRYRGHDSPSSPIATERPRRPTGPPALQKLDVVLPSSSRRADLSPLENRLSNLDGFSPPTNSPKTATFPLHAQYTFTFKLMIHKLYDVRGFLDMVKGVVEKSQTEFKPLAEQHSNKDNTGGRCRRARNTMTVFGSNIMTSPSTCTRRHSTIGTVEWEKRPVFVAKGQVSVSRDGGWQADIRVVKKRCIDRNKSEMPFSSEITRTAAEWTYKATGSLIERNHPKRYHQDASLSTMLPDSSKRMKIGRRSVDITRKHWSCDGASLAERGQGLDAWQWQPSSPTFGVGRINRGNQHALDLADSQGQWNDRAFATEKPLLVA